MIRALSLFLCWIGFAEAALGEPMYRLHTKLEIVAITPAAAVQLLPRLNDADRSGEALAELDAHVKSGAAEMLHRLGIPCLPEQRVQVESHEEYRFPTEFEPPMIPAPPPPTVEPPALGPSAPTSFETRNVGAQYQLEVSLTPQAGLFDVLLYAELTLFDRYKDYPGSADHRGARQVLGAPDFFHYRVDTHFAIRSGTRKLIGVFNSAKPKPRMILFIFGATAQPVTAAGQ